MDESFFTKEPKIKTLKRGPKFEPKKELDERKGNEENISNNDFPNANFETEVNTSHSTSHTSLRDVTPVSESNPVRNSILGKASLKITSKNAVEIISNKKTESNVKKQKDKQVLA